MVLTGVEREYGLIKTMWQSAIRYLSHGEAEALDIALARGVKWELEWRIALGEMSDAITRKRKGIAVPSTPAGKVTTWRAWERKAGVRPMVRLGDVQENLTAPEDRLPRAVVEWIDRLDERKEELRRWKSAEMREKMMENAEERRDWHESFAKGKNQGTGHEDPEQSQRGAHY